jgi:hypothetical protein
MPRRAGAVVIVALVVLTVGLSVGGLVLRHDRPADGGRTAAAEPGDRYAQTWPKAYDATSCDEFLHAMSDRQQFAAAADLLVRERIKGDSPGMPAEDLIEAFRAGLAQLCAAAPELGVTGTATSYYGSERERFRR